MIKETHEWERMRLLVTPPKTATAPAASNSITARIVECTRDLISNRGVILEGKRIGYSKFTTNVGQNGRSAGYSESTAVALTQWLGKKGREASSVADGLRPAEENDVLELDERKGLSL